MTDETKPERLKYWPTVMAGMEHGYAMELRSMLAWELIHHFGSVAGTPSTNEDSAGRNYLRLQIPRDLVARCFQIADLAVDEMERRGEIRQYGESDEEKATYHGQLLRIKSRAEYPVAEMPGTVNVEISKDPTTEELKLRTRHALERSELRRRQSEEMKEGK